ncbi:uncharacterized protein C2orf16-like [Carassius carassius]|uniref:uncharacterized protein C2orf16-like n=1 Tax=Carassius carassius TaxID=217509 RepID=UPI00286967AD|nr:uncharacterized protein C2orf16-like [Carassius carassius]
MPISWRGWSFSTFLPYKIPPDASIVDTGSAGDLISGDLCKKLQLQKSNISKPYSIHAVMGEIINKGPNQHFLSSQESNEEPVKRKPVLPKVPSIPPLLSLLHDAISSSDEPFHALGPPEPSYHLPSQSSRHHGTPEPSYHLPSQSSRHHGTPEPSYHLPSQSSRHHGTPEPSYHLSSQSSRHHGTPEPSYHLLSQSSHQHGTPQPFHLAPHAASEMDLHSALLREIIAKQEVMCDMQRNLLRIVQDLSSTPTPHGHQMDGSFLPLRDAEALLALDRNIKTNPEKRKVLVLTLGLAGGVTLKDTVWRVMKMLLQDS